MLSTHFLIVLTDESLTETPSSAASRTWTAAERYCDARLGASAVAYWLATTKDRPCRKGKS
jgi:hypothetical protein